VSGRRAVVISGGPGAEHDISLSSGRAIAAALDELGFAVATCTVARDGTWSTDGRAGLGVAVATLAAADIAVPALHGPWGEDGSVQGFLETVGVPYVGSGVLASATCMDKARTKLQLAAAGICVAPGRTVRAPLDADTAAALVAQLGLPLFVKPLQGGSSYGVTRVTDVGDLPQAVTAAAAYGAAVLVEPEIRGLEIDVGVLERPDGTTVAGPLLQIEADPGEPFFSTAAKYACTGTRFLVPAPVDPGLAGAICDTALRAFAALGCAGLARVDFFVGERRGLIVNEVNTFPGFTEHSQFPLMWAAASVSFTALVATLVETALSAPMRSGSVRPRRASPGPAPSPARRSRSACHRACCPEHRGMRPMS
jgi:D-alanine-D-alanine ligase